MMIGADQEVVQRGREENQEVGEMMGGDVSREGWKRRERERSLEEGGGSHWPALASLGSRAPSGFCLFASRLLGSCQ
jgi:hypothetical protein